MAELNAETLSDAIARNSAIVVSLPSAGMFRHIKSRLLASDPGGIWVEAVLSERLLIEELISTKKPVGITFKHGGQRVAFATSALSLDPEYQINASTCLPALLVVNPAKIKTVQRRMHYRIRTYDGCGLSAQIWRISATARLGDRPVKAQQLNVNLRDISVGGIGVVFTGEEGKPPKVSTEDRLRIELRYGEEVVLVEGRMRAPFGPQPDNALSVGICFKEMEKDIEGRRMLTQLTRITGELQREEMRRTRLGLK
jgi:c-di-GMP-binding flagellar brake protein YcgR